jgi:hypothetical protein
MKWLFRPSASLVIAGVLAMTAVGVLWYTRPAPPTAVALEVKPGELEIAWLYPATNPSAWTRFVGAVDQAVKRLAKYYPGLEVQAGTAAFPEQSVAVAEVAVRWPGATGRLLFRWYKLTSDRKSRDWLTALKERSVPPLAILAGNTSDGAREVALHLDELTETMPEANRPLLLLTTATADLVPMEGMRHPEPEDPNQPERGASLMKLYPERTFRFCFTNQQMAAAVSHFIWTQNDLRPDSDPPYLVSWTDDSYSRDLIDGFWDAQIKLMGPSVASEWAWASSQFAGLGLPALIGGVLPMERAGPNGSAYRLAIPPTPQRIDSSVGTFGVPNRFEAEAARFLLDDRARYPQQRPLLIVTGQWQPCRRFLRALVRREPLQARRFVIATGDAISFNTVYRDRQVTWHVQDLPFPLVFFCHHNPIDPLDGKVGFRTERDGSTDPTENGESPTTGTEDLLLFEDIVESLVLACRGGAQPCADAAQLAARFRELRFLDGHPAQADQGPLLFSPRGNRRSATGAHVVCLRPRIEGDTVLPEATIEVWAWQHDPDTRALRGPWERFGKPLIVRYDDVQRGGPLQ